MRRVLFLVALMTCVLGVSAASATDCNFDLVNKGIEDAYDVEIILDGTIYFSGFYNGLFGESPVGNPSVEYVGGKTKLHWQNPINPAGPISKDEMIHVGYTPVGTNHCCLREVWWTNKCGDRISSSYVGTIWNHATNTSVTIENRSSSTVNVDKVRMACQATALPLASLNRNNTYLAAAMVPIAGPNTLQPGQSWVIPAAAACTSSPCYCVTTAESTAPGLGADLTTWVQERVQ